MAPLSSKRGSGQFTIDSFASYKPPLLGDFPTSHVSKSPNSSRKAACASRASFKAWLVFPMQLVQVSSMGVEATKP